MRGHTLLEMTLAAGMLGVLMAAIVFVYVIGASAWRKGDTQAELTQDLQTAGARLAVDLQESSYAALSVGPSQLSLLSPLNERGEREYRANQPLLRWSRYRLYYVTNRALMRRTIDLPPGAPQRDRPDPLEAYLPGNQASGGEVIIRNVTRFAPELIGLRTVKVQLDAEKMRYGHRDPEKASRVFMVRVRN